MTEVRCWLERYRMGKYADAFERNEFDTMDAVVNITEQDLIDMNITKVGARRKILVSAARERSKLSGSNQPTMATKSAPTVDASTISMATTQNSSAAATTQQQPTIGLDADIRHRLQYLLLQEAEQHNLTVAPLERDFAEMKHLSIMSEREYEQLLEAANAQLRKTDNRDVRDLSTKLELVLGEIKRCVSEVETTLRLISQYEGEANTLALQLRAKQQVANLVHPVITPSTDGRGNTLFSNSVLSQQQQQVSSTTMTSQRQEPSNDTTNTAPSSTPLFSQPKPVAPQHTLMSNIGSSQPPPSTIQQHVSSSGLTFTSSAESELTTVSNGQYFPPLSKASWSTPAASINPTAIPIAGTVQNAQRQQVQSEFSTPTDVSSRMADTTSVGVYTQAEYIVETTAAVSTVASGLHAPHQNAPPPKSQPSISAHGPTSPSGMPFGTPNNSFAGSDDTMGALGGPISNTEALLSAELLNTDKIPPPIVPDPPYITSHTLTKEAFKTSTDSTNNTSTTAISGKSLQTVDAKKSTVTSMTCRTTMPHSGAGGGGGASSMTTNVTNSSLFDSNNDVVQRQSIFTTKAKVNKPRSSASSDGVTTITKEETVQTQEETGKYNNTPESVLAVINKNPNPNSTHNSNHNIVQNGNTTTPDRPTTAYSPNNAAIRTRSPSIGDEDPSPSIHPAYIKLEQLLEKKNSQSDEEEGGRPSTPVSETAHTMADNEIERGFKQALIDWTERGNVSLLNVEVEGKELVNEKVQARDEFTEMIRRFTIGSPLYQCAQEATGKPVTPKASIVHGGFARDINDNKGGSLISGQSHNISSISNTTSTSATSTTMGNAGITAKNGTSKAEKLVNGEAPSSLVGTKRPHSAPPGVKNLIEEEPLDKMSQSMNTHTNGKPLQGKLRPSTSGNLKDLLQEQAAEHAVLRQFNEKYKEMLEGYYKQQDSFLRGLGALQENETLFTPTFQKRIDSAPSSKQVWGKV